MGRQQQGRRRDDARDLARQLRRQGWTYDQIARELGVAKSSCSLWLRDLQAGSAPAPAGGGEEPDAQRLAQRLQARRLRREGRLLGEIAEALGISLTTASRWCTGLPVPERAAHGRHPDEVRAMQRARWDRVLAEREQERVAARGAASGRVGRVTARELELMAVVLYWAEGAKSKPWARRERVTFINSDPGAVRLWLAYLDLVQFPEEHRRYQLSIHATADLERAHAVWADVAGVPLDRFQPPSLKRHQPATRRKNVDDAYTGCLVVRCVQSRTLYQRIEGTWQGIMAGAARYAA